MFKPELPTGWVSVDPLPVFQFPYHRVSTELLEFNLQGSLGKSYQQAGHVTAPTQRVFTLSFPTMQMFPGRHGRVDLLESPGTNFALLDLFYARVNQARIFWYPHPALGLVQCRFKEPLATPAPVGNRGTLASFQLKLVEVITRLSQEGNRDPAWLPTWEKYGGLSIFPFVFHTVETSRAPESSLIQLGRGYTFATAPAKPEQRTFRLTFPTMRMKLTAAGKLDCKSNLETNLAALDYFYSQHRNTDIFSYNHPVYGRTMVRFKKPPELPAGIPSGNGWSEPVTIELLEAI